MMQDARDGKFDIIYTKSVSRFARNTVQLLEAVRELRDLGIEVIFEKEQISTMQPTSELFLTIAATVAENDLQVDSERQKWSFRHRFENGWISIGSGMYGYTMTKDNNLVIVEEEAAVIRRIYDMYISGMGCPAIAKVLNEEGIRTWCGNEWKPTRLLELMANEKYMGDSMMGKSVTVDGIQMDNMDGQYGKRYYMEDTHEGIVSRDTWELAQQIREQRRNKKIAGSKKPVYPFTSMIECGCCGKHYQHKVNNSGKKWRNDIWACPERPVSFRVSRIKEIKRSHARSGKITEKQKYEIDKKLQTDGVQFLLQDAEPICIKLSGNGKKLYESTAHLRPPFLTRVKGADGNWLYTFQCTQLQAEYYFFKFGPEAEVLSPLALRSRFANRYEDARTIYSRVISELAP